MSHEVMRLDTWVECELNLGQDGLREREREREVVICLQNSRLWHHFNQEKPHLKIEIQLHFISVAQHGQHQSAIRNKHFTCYLVKGVT